MSYYVSIEEYHKYIREEKKWLQSEGYRCLVVKEYALQDDELYIHPDTLRAYRDGKPNPKYIYFFKCYYWNNYTDIQKIRRYRKLNKWQQRFIEDYAIA